MLLQILTRTPPWVFAVFVLLLAVGLLQSRTRMLAPAAIAVLPLVLMGLSLFGVWSAFGQSATAYAAWGAAVACALLLNRRVRWPRGVRYEPAARRYHVPGSWAPLALMMAIFFARYAVAVTVAMRPSFAASAPFVATASFAYGLLSGCFLARAIQILGAATSPSAAGAVR